VSQYFDGRRTDDEILYRAAITRRQFKEIIGAYSEYVSHCIIFFSDAPTDTVRLVHSSRNCYILE
jgi:hypothetical protein